LLTYEGYLRIWQRDRGKDLNSEYNKHIHGEKASFSCPCCKYSKEIDMVEDFANTLNLKIMRFIRQMFLENTSTQCKSFGGTKDKRQGRLRRRFAGAHAASNTSAKSFPDH